MSARPFRLAVGAFAGLALGTALCLAADVSSTAHAAPPTATPGDVTDFAKTVDDLLAQDFLEGDTVGLLAVDLETGETLYARNANTPLNPASNQKLITTAAALHVLGPEHRYATRLYGDDGALRGTTLESDLYLQGGGDPSLTTGDLYELALRLRGEGVQTIKGKIVVDATRFDADGLPPGFDQKDEFASYRAPLGAASVNFNTYVLVTRPGTELGKAASLTLEPAVDSIELVNTAQTVEGTRNQIIVTPRFEADKTVLEVSGEIGLDARSGSFRYPVQDPSRYAGEVLRLVLNQAGIKVKKKQIGTGKVPRGADLLASHRSDSLSVQIRAVNKLSNNFMAEQILRTLAPDDGATAEGSLRALAGAVDEIGLDAKGMRLGNGSGLYDNNRVSPKQLVTLLTKMHGDFRYRADYLASLSVGGADGTARRRLAESPAKRWVRVKTGTLNDVSALSGYVGRFDREPIVFAILMNDLERVDKHKARNVQTAIVEALYATIEGSTSQ